MNTSLKDKWVFITGASAGFGAEGALHFAREGAHAVIGARRVDRLETVAADYTGDQERFVGTIPHLTDWVYNGLPEEHLTAEAGQAFATQCAAQ